jgi:uncharacterized membrane-anchored protein YitT (DUF2179 family)
MAAGVYNFAMAAEFPMTGITGIAVLLYRIIHLPVGLGIILMNIPLAIWSYRLLGRRFFVGSVRCMLVSSLMMDYIAPFFPIYQGDRLLAAICMGVLSGFGFGLIYMQGSSTGGIDFVVMGIKNKRPYMSVGKITLLCDMLIILAGAFFYGDVDGMIYGILGAFIQSTVLDKLMYGTNAAKLALVVTDDGKKISAVINDTCDRGTTIIPAIGGYYGAAKDVVMCACGKREMYQMTEEVKRADPAAFIILLESNEVHGEGFRRLALGETPNKSAQNP